MNCYSDGVQKVSRSKRNLDACGEGNDRSSNSYLHSCSLPSLFICFETRNEQSCQEQLLELPGLLKPISGLFKRSLSCSGSRRWSVFWEGELPRVECVHCSRRINNAKLLFPSIISGHAVDSFRCYQNPLFVECNLGTFSFERENPR